jgi:hypothetical protein
MKRFIFITKLTIFPRSLSHFFILLAKLPNKVKNRYRLLFFHGCASGNGKPAPTA